jgi:hypothetical protein
MKLNSRILLKVLMVLMLLAPLVAADNSTLPAVPSFNDGWSAIGSTAQGQVIHLINIVFMVAVVGAALYTLYGLLNYLYGGRSHNPEQRNAGFGQLVMGLFVMIVSVIMYEVIVNMFARS